MGIMGPCRANEMYLMKIDDLQDIGNAFLVTIPSTKTKSMRQFTITNKFYEIVKKYLNLRPGRGTVNSFFLNYQDGKCTTLRIGINKFAAMGRQIATFLCLPNPKSYTGHSFLRSSATLLVDASGDITALRRCGRWKSSRVVDGYVDNFVPIRPKPSVKKDCEEGSEN